MYEWLKEFEEKMNKSVNYFADDLVTLRAGRANPGILDKVMVEYYGTPTPIGQIGNISVPEPHMITIQPWDATALGDIEKAINKSDLGINPQNDGKIIRLTFPTPTEERRKELVKSLSKKTEEARVHIRSIRRDAVDAAKAKKKDGEITEDGLKDVEVQIQKLTDKKIKDAEEIAAKKEKEILEV